MVRVCKNNKESVLAMVRKGKLDAAALSTSNLVDEIILSMSKHGVLDCLSAGIPDRRGHNKTVPFELIWASAIAAKMKIHSSLSDIPFAITDHRTLAELGYTLYDPDGTYNGLMRESSLRFLIGKYTGYELVGAYRRTVQRQILPQLDVVPHIHIMDSTPLEVNLDNPNYELSAIGRNKHGEPTRGYTMLTVRGLYKDTGIIEEAVVVPMSCPEIEIARALMKVTKVLHEGDILINDRGFISRDIINLVKTTHKTDSYIPLRKNMDAYKYAVQIAKAANKWEDHPNKKRIYQKIALVKNIGPMWQSDKPAEDVDMNACVVWDIKTDNYFVFVSTDLTKSARAIVKTYELRPEIEEDYRQLKDFWNIEDFKSTKFSVIAFHIVCVLFGYLFFQLYTMLPEGQKFEAKSLPVALKNFIPQALGYIVLYVGINFGIFTLVEIMRLYAECEDGIKPKIEEVLGGV